MMPAGVVRIIWAIAPTAELREAMLGDFAEEYDAHLRREGRASANFHAWLEAILSLGGTLYRNTPGIAELFTTILPAIVWGYLVATLASMAAAMLFFPAIYRFVPVSHSMAWIVGLGPMWLATAVLAGYEAARVGKRSPLWSALALGMLMALASVRVIALVWFWPFPWLLAPAFCLAGAVLQQGQSHKLACEIAKEA